MKVLCKSIDHFKGRRNGITEHYHVWKIPIGNLLKSKVNYYRKTYRKLGQNQNVNLLKIFLTL